MLYMVSEFLISNLRNCCPDEEIKMLCRVLWHSESLVDRGFLKKIRLRLSATQCGCLGLRLTIFVVQCA